MRTERILEEVDWTLLLFFAGLFVVMHGVEASGLAQSMIAKVGGVQGDTSAGKIAGLSLVSAVLSNLVSNVPAVMLLKPLTQSLGAGFWLALAMSSTLAGNLTLIGSVANLIVVEQAKRKVQIGFMEYFRTGALITVITMAIGIVFALEVRTAHGAERSGSTSQKVTTIGFVSADEPHDVKAFRVVLVCATSGERIKGLQGFRKLNTDEAALFIFDKPEAVNFWMATVSYPLDIIYVAADKTVTRVARNCRPGSDELYPSGGEIKWVVETAAGSAVRTGDKVKIEKRVRHETVNRRQREAGLVCN